MPDTTEDTAFEDVLRELARTPDVTGSRPPLGPGRRLAGRFEIDEPLGEGGMGRVFAAFDLKRETQVALKVLGSITPRSILQIKQEFRAAAELTHPNLVKLHELFSDGVEWFFTMDLIDGVGLSTLRRRAGGLSAELLETLFRQLALALVALHRAGNLHGDLKPSNFLVTRERQLVLLDFGLARPLSGASKGYARSGTPGYMSPEQSAGAPLTEATDWYSYGVVLYEALAQKLPGELPVHTGDLLDAPPHLRALCHDLLQRDPGVRPRGEQVLRRLGAPSTGVTLNTARGAARELIGRHRELSDLRSAFAGIVSTGRPVVALVHGPSGIGKTSLVQHFVAGVRADGGVVLSGRCRERESVGHKAIDVLIDDLISLLEGMPTDSASKLLPAGMSDLTRLFPTLRAVSAVTRAANEERPTAGAGAAKVNAIRAFRELLVNLAQRAPLVVWIDDLQWADVDSAALLEPVLAQADGLPLLFVGSFRSRADGWAPILNALYEGRQSHLPPPQELALLPLAPVEARALAMQFLDAADGAPALASTIVQEAGGHPLLVSELARAAGASVAPGVLKLPELIDARMGTLSSDARALVEIMALAGAPLNRSVVRLANGLDAARAERALDLLRTHHLIRSDGMGEESELDVFHDRIREIIAQHMPRAKRQASHFALARALVAQRNQRPDLIADHFAAADAPGQAGPYWIAAGDSAAQSLAFDRAAELYRLGAAHAKLAPEDRHLIRMRQAKMLAYAGRGREAAELYLQGAQERPGDQIIHLERLAAEQLLLVGHWDRGLEVIDRVLRTLGMGALRGGYRLRLSFLIGRLRVRLRGLHFKRRPEEEIPPKQLASIDAAWTVAWSLSTVDFLRGADLQNVNMLLALRAGEPSRVLRALIIEVGHSAAPGKPASKRMQRLLRLVDDLSAQTTDPSALGMGHLIKGLALYLQGHMVPAHVHLERAVDTFRTHCAGAVWETMTAHRFSIASSFFLGRFDELHKRVPVLAAEATAQRNLYAATWCRTHFATVAWLVNDDVEEARKQLLATREEEPSGRFPIARISLLVSDIYLDLYTGEPNAPLERLQAQWDELNTQNLLRIGIIRIQFWYLRSACALLAAEQERKAGLKQRARRLLAEARGGAARLRDEPAPIAAPLSLLLQANIDTAEGEPVSAALRLSRAVEQCELQGLAMFAAAARTRWSDLLQGEQAARMRALAQGAFATEGVTNWRAMVNLLAPAWSEPSPRW